jgi:hypothetical protein
MGFFSRCWRYGQGVGLVVAARTASPVGDEVRPFALVFAALGAERSALSVGVVLAAGVVPQLGLLLVGGWWGDTRSPVRTLILADAVRAGPSLPLPVCG